MTAFAWQAFLDRHRTAIIDQWQHRLRTEVSGHYARRPEAELCATTGSACDAFARYLAARDLTPINQFISEITRIRLDAGFPLSDVQKAFELYRWIIIPILVAESPKDLLCENIQAVNQGLAYTIHRFSDHFQKMHQTHLEEYASRLEKDVAARTAELKDSEQRYRRLVEEIRDGYLILQKARIEFVNPAFCNLHGIVPQDALGHPFLEFVAEEHREKVRQLVTNESPDEGEPEAFEYLRLTRDGRCLPTEVNFRPSWYKGRSYHLCIVRDITKRVEMEKESREMERMAYIGQLTTSLSHEIRNPLSSVKMNLQILGKNETFVGNDKQRLKISEREINRLEGILQQLLDFAKPVSLKRASVDLNQVIRQCVELLEVKINKRNTLCQFQEDPGLPPLTADRSKLEQLTLNLLLNALDSMPGGGLIRISTRVQNRDDRPHAVIRIRDTGTGIPEENLQRIFEPFYTTKTVGTGLGLANVRQIVEAHQGRVAVQNSDGPGTVFEIFLPLNPPGSD